MPQPDIASINTFWMREVHVECRTTDYYIGIAEGLTDYGVILRTLESNGEKYEGYVILVPWSNIVCLTIRKKDEPLPTIHAWVPYTDKNSVPQKPGFKCTKCGVFTTDRQGSQDAHTCSGGI